MFKIGVGPSSSHTLGPWRAASSFIEELVSSKLMDSVDEVLVDLYGSLALTGEGHGTDMAVIMGLSGHDPVTVSRVRIEAAMNSVLHENKLVLGEKKEIHFNYGRSIHFRTSEILPYHSNAMKFIALNSAGTILQESTYYSIGGGFVVDDRYKDGVKNEEANSLFPYPVHSARQLHQHCDHLGLSISEVVMTNERALRTEDDITDGLKSIWTVMLSSVYKGCHTRGILPGGLGVRRRAPGMHDKLFPDKEYKDQDQWLECLKSTRYEFPEILDWVSCFALAVNEENADYGRIVTAPTNGSAGVIPAVLLYAICFDKRAVGQREINNFLLVASEIGSLFKKGATISAAAGGCQAEIGVSSAMAAAGLTYLRGGSPHQCLIAAEIAMEHHLGLTCDPVKGLVQIPCIERNSLGAIKAIAAAGLAHKTEPDSPKISLDDVIKTMWETAKDMHHNYKETSLGGLAKTVLLPEC